MKIRAVYREKRDKFLVDADVNSTDGRVSAAITVLHVYRNDPRHGIQYMAGDQFVVSCANPCTTHPQLSPGWTLTIPADDDVDGVK